MTLPALPMVMLMDAPSFEHRGPR